MIKMLHELKKAKLEIKPVMNQKNGGKNAKDKDKALEISKTVEEIGEGDKKNKFRREIKKSQNEKGKDNKLETKEANPHDFSNFFSLKSNFF